MKWAPQQIIIIKKHFCDVKIWLFPVQRLSTLQQLELSSTQCSQLKFGLTSDTGRANKLSSDFLFFKFWFHMKWTNHKLRFDIYRRHMHKSFELFVVSCRVLRISRQRDPWQHAASLPQQEQAPPEEDLFLCFFCIFSGFSSGFLFYFVRRQLKRKVEEKISYMSPGHSSWPGYNRELLLGRRRPPTKKDI